MENPSIKIKKGLDEMLFGMTMDEIKRLLGEPDEVEDATEDSVILWNYWDPGLCIFFNTDEDNRCEAIETDNPEVTLFGNKIFDLTEEEIIELFKSKKFIDVESEVEEWGEKRVSICDAAVDMYFDKGELVSVNWGVEYGDDEKIIWPE